jgi:hypothetical protein
MVLVSGVRMSISAYKMHKESSIEETNCSGSPVQKPRKRFY